MVLESTTGRILTVSRPWESCDQESVGAHRPWTSQHAIAYLRLPACDGRRGLAHAAWVKRLFIRITIPSVSTSVHQGSTDFEVRRGLAPLSVSALQSVPCICPPTSQPMADGPSRETRCPAPASSHVFCAFCSSVCRQALPVNTRPVGQSPAKSPQEERCLACPSAPNAWSSSWDM
jgi:hypothetical protein